MYNEWCWSKSPDDTMTNILIVNFSKGNSLIKTYKSILHKQLNNVTMFTKTSATDVIVFFFTYLI